MMMIIRSSPDSCLCASHGASPGTGTVPRPVTRTRARRLKVCPGRPPRRPTYFRLTVLMSWLSYAMTVTATVTPVPGLLAGRPRPLP